MGNHSSAVAPPRTVNVDLKRYSGHWYALYEYPKWFQSATATDVQAYYRFVDSKTLLIRNQELRSDGKWHVVDGIAHVVAPGQLRVEFTSLPIISISGNYWIVSLMTNDRGEYTMSIVTDPTQSSLWILLRTATISDVLQLEIFDRLVRLGFTMKKLRKISHSGSRHQQV
jgi:lipocalin